jgi:CDP-diacylglycerol--serine O-phosphatidyltransferase
MVFALSFLMVSNIHYFSFKELNLGRIKSFNWLVAALLFFILIAVQPQVVSFLVVAAYVVLGPFAAKIMHRRRLAQEQSKQAEQALSSSDGQA